MELIWSSSANLQKREALHGDIRVQTVIIGAGMTRILTAYLLKKNGLDAVIIEAKQMGSGQTERTTAKITSQHGMIYDKLLRKTGRKRAEIYARANEEAIRLYEKIIREEQIECHFKRLPAYLYTREENRVRELKREAVAARALGIHAAFVEDSEIYELPFEINGAVRFENQAQFHPLEFIKYLAKDLKIYENTKAISVKGHEVYTDRGTITAENIVFATHYPFINVPGFYFLREHQERSYVLALAQMQELSGMYYSIDKKGLSLRSAGDILLLGGGGHRTGKITCHEGIRYLKEMAGHYYPDSEECAVWSAQDCMPHDGIPFIGKYSIFRPYWYVATGFHKWGMTSAMVSAVIISNKICGIPDLYEKAFTPQRLLLRAGIKNLLIDIGESVLGLGKGLFSKKENKCPHMGCRLEWNPQEQTWECPCHGSRFSEEGELRDNPAQVGLRKN